MNKWQKEEAKTHSQDSVPRDSGPELAGGGRGHQLVGVGRAEGCRDRGRTFLCWNPRMTPLRSIYGET